VRTFPGFLAATLLCAGCATTGTQGLSQVAAAEPAPAAGQEEKQSLDKLLDENEKVTLVDDETGETKLVCRRIKPRTGTRLGDRKLCATKKQWRETEIVAQKELDKTQRNMNAACPTCQ
jgi:hypothetical protein